MKKRLIDEKGKLFGKVNIIDLGIVILVLLVAVGAYVKFVVLEQTAVATEVFPVHYTLEVVGVRDWTVGNIQVGDTLFSNNVAIGTIVSVEAEPHEIVITGEGKVWWGEVPERYVVFVGVEGTAILSEGRYLISRTVPMAVGNSGSFFATKFAEFNATVREITPHEG